MSILPRTASIAPGASQNYTVTLTPSAGTTSAFSLSASGLGAGLYATFSPASVTPTVMDPHPTSTLTIDTTTAAATGQHGFDVTATAGSLTCSVPAEIVLNATAGFSLSVSAPVGTVDAGSSWTRVVTVNTAGGFTAPVTLGFSSPTEELTGSFSPRTVIPTAQDPNPASTLTLTARPTIADGLHSFTIGAIGGDETVGYQGTVQIGPPADFSLLVAPSSGSVEQDSSRNYVVIVAAQGGFSSEISLSVSDLGTGLSGSFSPSSVTPTAEDPTPVSTLTISAASSAATGSDEFTLTGTAGSLNRTATATVEVLTPSSQEAFTLSVDPIHYFMLQGSSETFSIDVTRTGGFDGIVELSVLRLTEGLTATFSDDSLSSSETSSNLTIEASENYSGGGVVYFEVAAHSADLGYSRTEWLVVIVTGFTLQVSEPDDQEIMRNGSLTYALGLTRTTYFNDAVRLSILGLDSESGLAPSFSANPVHGAESTLTIAAGPNAVAGAYDFVIVAKSEDGTLVRTHSQSVTVTGPDFSLSVLPWGKSVARAPPGDPGCNQEENTAGSTACAQTFMVKVVPRNGFTESVSLTLSPLLTGLSGSFSPNSVTPSILSPTPTSILTIVANSTATLGYHQFTITGTGGGHTRTTTARVEVYVGRECRCAEPWSGNPQEENQ